MPEVTLPPVPYKSKIEDPRQIGLTQAWAKFFRHLFQRVGGESNVSTASGLTGDLIADVETLNDRIEDLRKGRVVL